MKHNFRTFKFFIAFVILLSACGGPAAATATPAPSATPTVTPNCAPPPRADYRVWTETIRFEAQPDLWVDAEWHSENSSVYLVYFDGAKGEADPAALQLHPGSWEVPIVVSVERFQGHLGTLYITVCPDGNAWVYEDRPTPEGPEV